jgi:hypothetical protein
MGRGGYINVLPFLSEKNQAIKRLFLQIMPMQCHRCTKEAILYLPYGPHHFCQEHFEYFFEKRVRNVTRIHEFFEEGEKIAIAVSGGKDSVVALNLMKQIMPRHEIVGISIDEGIEGYRNKAIDEALKNYKALDVDYKIVKYEQAPSHPETGGAPAACDAVDHPGG